MKAQSALPDERLPELLEQMWLIRYFDEKIDEMFAKGLIHGTTHLYVGQEAVAVGACADLTDDDYITSTHRGHGHCIAKGADVNKMMAEILGKETGYCKGKGGSMHIADVSTGNLGANGIVGGGIPIATGAALTLHMQKRDNVVLCFFGDGAANEGSFHESLNLAAIWKLPVVFICENNQYGMSGSVKDMFAIADIAERSAAYGIPGTVVDGNDLFDVYASVKEAIARAKAGEGPTLIECKTYRWKGHSKSDAKKYRTREEEKEWRAKDPIRRLETYLKESGQMEEGDLRRIESAAQQKIEDAVKFAEESERPNPEEIEQDVYA